jgi:hypothetical protein
MLEKLMNPILTVLNFDESRNRSWSRLEDFVGQRKEIGLFCGLCSVGFVEKTRAMRCQPLPGRCEDWRWEDESDLDRSRHKHSKILKAHMLSPQPPILSFASLPAKLAPLMSCTR